MTDAQVPSLAMSLDGPAVEQHIAKDIVLKRALPVAPVFLVVCGLFWGLDGALSSAFALALVCINFALAASLLAWSARISLGMMMVTALAGYVLRLGLLFGAVFAVRNLSWVELVPMGLTIIISHLGLLFWETRYVSASLAFPGLKPGLGKK